MLDDVPHAPARTRVAFLLDDQRHVDGLVVDEQAVLLLAMISEALAVIGQQHDGGPIVQLVGFQIGDERADDFVRAGDFAVVGRVLSEPRRRGVRFVRLVQMKEQKRARGAGRREPSLGNGLRRRAVALHLEHAHIGQ